MRKLWVILVACLWTAGCVDFVPIDRVKVLRPGRDMDLTYRSELHRYTTQVQEERHRVWPDEDESPHIVIKRVEIPEDYFEWYDLDVDVAVSAEAGTQNAQAKMTVSRLRMHARYEKEGETRQEHKTEYRPQSPPPPSSRETDSGELFAEMLDGAEFFGVVDPNGKIVSAKAVGKYWKDMEGQLARPGDADAEQLPVDVAARLATLGVLVSLDDALAYLPPPGMAASQSWTVHRDHVVPYIPSLAFCMMMEGGVYAQEESTCRLKGVWIGPRGRVADIAITGKRLVRPARPESLHRIAAFEIAGNLELNLTTGAVEKLRIESTPIKDDPDGHLQEFTLAQEISLKPRR